MKGVDVNESDRTTSGVVWGRLAGYWGGRWWKTRSIWPTQEVHGGVMTWHCPRAMDRAWSGTRIFVPVISVASSYMSYLNG